MSPLGDLFDLLINLRCYIAIRFNRSYVCLVKIQHLIVLNSDGLHSGNKKIILSVMISDICSDKV